MNTVTKVWYRRARAQLGERRRMPRWLCLPAATAMTASLLISGAPPVGAGAVEGNGTVVGGVQAEINSWTANFNAAGSFAVGDRNYAFHGNVYAYNWSAPLGSHGGGNWHFGGSLLSPTGAVDGWVGSATSDLASMGYRRTETTSDSLWSLEMWLSGPATVYLPDGSTLSIHVSFVFAGDLVDDNPFDGFCAPWAGCRYQASYTEDDGTALVGVNARGDASGQAVGVSGTGHAQGGTGAVSGTGGTWSGLVGASGTGMSDGPGTNVSGETYLIGTGLLSGPVTPEQAELSAEGMTIPDAENFTTKQQALAEGLTWTAQNMVLHVGDGFGDSRSSSSMTESTSAPPAEALNTPFHSQDRWYYCLPAVMQMYMNAWGTPNYNQNSWAGALRTKHPQNNNNDKTAGTPLSNAVKVINDYKRHSDNMIWAQNENPLQLMGKISTDVYYYRHGMIVAIKTTAAEWWSHKGSVDTQHAILLHGYDHRGGGWLYVMDPFDYTRFGYNRNNFGGPNPGGSHKLRLTEVWKAVEAAGGWSVW